MWEGIDMYGAILGDMIGAPYEFDRGNKSKDFEMFNDKVGFTDDTVMTIAVAEALMDSAGKGEDEVKKALISSMQKWGRKYPNAGYGQRFFRWLGKENPEPYNSWGNGSAMRVSSVGWLCATTTETRKYARLTAEVTHNHPEGIKGAEAIATAIIMARNCESKEDIRDCMIYEFGYDLCRTCDEIRPHYHHVESCQETVPEAITAFLEGESFEDVICTAVSLGGDCDTLTCIAGSLAEAYYGVPEEFIEECSKRLPIEMLEVFYKFDAVKETLFLQTGEIDGDNFKIYTEERQKKVFNTFRSNLSYMNFTKLVVALRNSLVWIPCDAIMSDADYKSIEEKVKEAVDSGDAESLIGYEFSNQDEVRLVPDILQKDNKYFFPVFSSVEDMGDYGDEHSKVEKHFVEALDLAKNNDAELSGIVFNAFSDPFILDKELLAIIEGMIYR